GPGCDSAIRVVYRCTAASGHAACGRESQDAPALRRDVGDPDRPLRSGGCAVAGADPASPRPHAARRGARGGLNVLARHAQAATLFGGTQVSRVRALRSGGGVAWTAYGTDPGPHQRRRDLQPAPEPAHPLPEHFGPTPPHITLAH